MKKIIFFITTLICFIQILSCEELKETEVEYKWYILKEKDIHYENDVENICEYFDKKDFIYTDYKYSLNEPEKKEGRVIEKSNEEMNIHRYVFNKFVINSFFIHYTNTIDISEISFYTNNNEIIPYTLENSDCSELYDNLDDTSCTFRNLSKLIFNFEEAKDLRDFNIVIKYYEDDIDFKGINFSLKLTEDISLNTFYSYNHIITHECNDDGLCTYKIKMDFDNMFNDDITFNNIVYRYKDTLYKCYSYERIYAPGYYKDLEGYIKDEEKYRIINNVENNQFEVNNDNLTETIDEIIMSKLNFTTIDEENEEPSKESFMEKPTSTVAMVNDTKDNTKENSNEYYLTYSIMIIILIIGTCIFIKKLKKSRTK